jgi:hypothetical protein
MAKRPRPARGLAPMSSSLRVRFCTYCKVTTIFPGRADDHISVFIGGDTRVAAVNAEAVIIQDGICEPCRAEKFPETVKRKEGQQ